MNRLLSKLPHRTQQSIYYKASKLGLTKTDEFLKYRDYKYSEKLDVDFPIILDKRKNNLKKCNTCNKFLPISDFYKDLTCYGGLYHECKYCDLNKQRVKNSFGTPPLLFSRLFGIIFYNKPDNSNISGNKNIRWINRDKRHSDAVKNGIKCIKCGKTKPINKFYKDKKRTNGFSGVCKKCMRNIYDDKTINYFNKCIISTFSQKKHKVKITKEYLIKLAEKQKYKCALTGIDLIITGKRKDHIYDPYLPSIDRIDSELGYVEGNVRWTCWGANRMHYIWSDDIFYDICKKAIEYKNNNN